MLFVREEIPSKLLSGYKAHSAVENIFIEINSRPKEWPLSCSCNPSLTLLNSHIQNVSRDLDFYSSKYNFIILRDFNAETSSTTISIFVQYTHQKTLLRSLYVSKAWKTQLVLILS